MGSEHPLVIAAADEGERAVALAVALAEWQHVFVDLAIHCADGVVLRCNRLIVAAMSPALRDLLLAPPPDAQAAGASESSAISLASVPALAALSGSALQRVLDWMYTQQCVAEGVASLVELFAAAKALQVPALQAACLAAARDHLTSAATLSAATAVCDEAKRMGGVHELWDCGFESLSCVLRRQRESCATPATDKCLSPSPRRPRSPSALQHPAPRSSPGPSDAKCNQRPDSRAAALQHTQGAGTAEQHIDDCESSPASANEWPHSFTACSAVHALAEKWSSTLSAPGALAPESEWESVVRRARMAADTAAAAASFGRPSTCEELRNLECQRHQREAAYQAQVSHLLPLSRSAPPDEHPAKKGGGQWHRSSRAIANYGHPRQIERGGRAGGETLSGADAASDYAAAKASLREEEETQSRPAAGLPHASQDESAGSQTAGAQTRAPGAHMPAAKVDAVTGAKRGERKEAAVEQAKVARPPDTPLRRRAAAAGIEWSGGGDSKEPKTAGSGGSSTGRHAQGAPSCHSQADVPRKPRTVRAGSGGGTRAPTPTKRAVKDCRAVTAKSPAGDGVRRPWSAPRLPLRSRYVPS